MPSSPLAYDDGQFVPFGEARVPLTDRAYLFGESVFVTVRCIDGAPVWWHEHLRRIAQGQAAVGLHGALPANLLQLVNQGATAFGEPECTMRLTLSANSPLGTPNSTDSLHFTLIVRPNSRPFGSGTGIAAALAETRRIPRACLPAEHKTSNYLSSILARREHPAYPEVLMRACDGQIASGSLSNFFAIRKDQLLTPSLDADCRPGLAREHVMQIAQESGLDVRQTRLEISELAGFDAIFFTNSTWGISTIRTLRINHETEYEYEPHRVLEALGQKLEAAMHKSADDVREAQG